MMFGDSTWIVPLFWMWVGIASLVFLSLFFIVAPYGRHSRGGWGPIIPARLGWVVMEVPSFAVILFLFVWSERSAPLMTWVTLIWCFHYFYRSFIYPALGKMTGKTMPLSVALMAVVFNIGNAGFNGMSLFFWLPESDVQGWVFGPLQILGFVFVVCGFITHVHSDSVLRGLRKGDETGYQIPDSGLHRLVASPNYFGEMIQWLGLAIMVNELAMWSFAIWTVANLLPRALSNLKWYQSEFPNYPKSRKALIPFVL